MMTGADAAPVGMSGCGFLIVVIDPEIFTPAADFRRRVAYAESIRTSRPVDPAKPMRVPFDRSAATRTARLRENRIEVVDAVYKTLCETADTHSRPLRRPLPTAGGRPRHSRHRSAEPAGCAF